MFSKVADWGPVQSRIQVVLIQEYILSRYLRFRKSAENRRKIGGKSAENRQKIGGKSAEFLIK